MNSASGFIASDGKVYAESSAGIGHIDLAYMVADAAIDFLPEDRANRLRQSKEDGEEFREEAWGLVTGDGGAVRLLYVADDKEHGQDGGLWFSLGDASRPTDAQRSSIQDIFAAFPDEEAYPTTWDVGEDQSGTDRRSMSARLGMVQRGGPGSGHFGHEGRPGERGGSLPGDAMAQGEERGGGRVYETVELGKIRLPLSTELAAANAKFAGPPVFNAMAALERGLYDEHRPFGEDYFTLRDLIGSSKVTMSDVVGYLQKAESGVWSWAVQANRLLAREHTHIDAVEYALTLLPLDAERKAVVEEWITKTRAALDEVYPRSQARETVLANALSADEDMHPGLYEKTIGETRLETIDRYLDAMPPDVRDNLFVTDLVARSFSVDNIGSTSLMQTLAPAWASRGTAGAPFASYSPVIREVVGTMVQVWGEEARRGLDDLTQHGNLSTPEAKAFLFYFGTQVLPPVEGQPSWGYEDDQPSVTKLIDQAATAAATTSRDDVRFFLDATIATFDPHQWIPPDEGKLAETANAVNRAWAHVSMTEAKATLMRQAADVFGGEFSFSGEKKPSDVDDAAAKERLTSEPQEVEGVLTAMYDRTQGWFRERGMGPDDTIPLYRGLSTVSPTWNPTGHFGLSEVRMWPLSSWTYRPRDTDTFAEEKGAIVAARVPVKEILAIADTGFPCQGEGEFVVLGRQPVVGTVFWPPEAYSNRGLLYQSVATKSRLPIVYPDLAGDWIGQKLARFGLTRAQVDGLEPADPKALADYQAAEFMVQRGGPGSGHHGHSGRPGERGGSLPGEGEDIFKRIGEYMHIGESKKYGQKTPQEVATGIETEAGFQHLWVMPDGTGIRIPSHDLAADAVKRELKKAVFEEGLPRTPEVEAIITSRDAYEQMFRLGIIRFSGYVRSPGAMPSIGVTVPGRGNPPPTTAQGEYISDIYFRLPDADWSVESMGGFNFPSERGRSFEEQASAAGLAIRTAPDPSAYLYVPIIGEDAIAAMATEIGRWLNRYSIEGMAVPPERLHCTLLYLEAITEEQIQRMFEGLALPLKFRCEVTGLARMGDALVALLDPDPALVRLQRDLHMAAKRVGATIGEFSNPADYKPHISLAYDLPPLLRLDDLNMDPAMFTHGEKLDVACSAFAIGRKDADGLRTIALPSHAGDRLFVVQGGVGIQPHITKSRPMVELTEEQWKTVMRGQPVYLPGTRRLITRADGPFRVRGGPGSGHFEHAGRPGERGGSLPGEAGQAGEAITGRQSNMDAELLASWSGLSSGDWKDEDQARVVDWCREFATPIKQEPEEYERTDGVIAPTGEMFRVDDHGGHEGFAKWALREVLEEKGGTPIGEVSEAGSPGEEMLMALGFTRMSHGGSGGFTRAVPSVALEWRNGAGPTSHQQSLITEIAKHAIDNDATVLWRDGQFFGAVNRLPNRDFTAAVTGQLDEIDPMLERSVLPSWSVRFFVQRGGPGSGHFDHAGIPGHQGGSLPSGVSGKYETEGAAFKAAEAEGWTRNLNVHGAAAHYTSPRIQVGEKDGQAVWRQQEARLRWNARDGYHWEVSEEKHAIGDTAEGAFGVAGTVIAFEPEPTASAPKPSTRPSSGAAPSGYHYRQPRTSKGGLGLGASPATAAIHGLPGYGKVSRPRGGSKFVGDSLVADDDLEARGGLMPRPAHGLWDDEDDLGEMESEVVERGGPGSGHHGHRGIPGHRGGSLPEEGGPQDKPRRTGNPIIKGAPPADLLRGIHRGLKVIPRHLRSAVIEIVWKKGWNRISHLPGSGIIWLGTKAEFIDMDKGYSSRDLDGHRIATPDEKGMLGRDKDGKLLGTVVASIREHNVAIAIPHEVGHAVQDMLPMDLARRTDTALRNYGDRVRTYSTSQYADYYDEMRVQTNLGEAFFDRRASREQYAEGFRLWVTGDERFDRLPKPLRAVYEALDDTQLVARSDDSENQEVDFVTSIGQTVMRSIREALGLVESGGPGSGHHGHAGIPGHRGGSLPGDEQPKKPEPKPRAPRKPREPKPTKAPAAPPAPPPPVGTRPKPVAPPTLKRMNFGHAYDRRIISRMAEEYAQLRFNGKVKSFAEYMATAGTVYYGERITSVFGELLQQDPASDAVLQEMANYFDKAAQAPYDRMVREAETQAAVAAYQPGDSRPFTDLARVPDTPKWEKVRNGFEAIDAVHNIPDLTNRILRPTPDLQLPIVESRGGRYFGQYVAMGSKAVSLRFNLGVNDVHAEMTAAHEVGHALDHLVFGAGRMYASSIVGAVDTEFSRGRVDAILVQTSPGDNSEALDRLENFHGVLQALTNSPSGQALRSYPTGWRTVETPTGETVSVGSDRKFIRYAAAPIEMFARGYSQYIAVRSGNPAMRSQLDVAQASSRRGDVPLQWQDDEFEPVASAFDKLFGDAGWLKK